MEIVLNLEKNLELKSGKLSRSVDGSSNTLSNRRSLDYRINRAASNGNGNFVFYY